MFIVEFASWILLSVLAAGMGTLLAPQQRTPWSNALIVSLIGALVGGALGRAVDGNVMSGTFSMIALCGAAIGAFLSTFVNRLALRRSSINV